MINPYIIATNFKKCDTLETEYVKSWQSCTWTKAWKPRFKFTSKKQPNEPELSTMPVFLESVDMQWTTSWTKTLISEKIQTDTAKVYKISKWWTICDLDVLPRELQKQFSTSARYIEMKFQILVQNQNVIRPAPRKWFIKSPDNWLYGTWTYCSTSYRTIHNTSARFYCTDRPKHQIHVQKLTKET